MLDINEYWQHPPPGVILTTIHEPTCRQCPPDEMQTRAAADVTSWFDGGANLPPAFFADFGTVTMAKPWGGRVQVTDGRAFIHPAAESLDEALALEPRDNADLAVALDVYRGLRRQTGRDDLGFKTPDFQGVLNTAAMVLREEVLLTAMLDEPDRLHAFLDRVCEANIAFMRAAVGGAGRVDGNIWPYAWLPERFGVMITEDLMPLLSPQQYKRFGLPYLKRISDAFGGVFIHCCGRWGRHAANLADSGIVVRGVEFHYPYTAVEEIRGALPDAVLVPYLAGYEETGQPGLSGVPVGPAGPRRRLGPHLDRPERRRRPAGRGGPPGRRRAAHRPGGLRRRLRPASRGGLSATTAVT